MPSESNVRRQARSSGDRLNLKTFTSFVNTVRKALIAAVAVASVIVVTSGIPTDVKAVAAVVVSVGATFGVVYGVKNKQ